MADPSFIFLLCVSGNDSRARQAEVQIRAVCEEVVPDDYQLTTVNVVECHPEDLTEPVLATPTLLRLAPGPTRRVVGDIGSEPQLLSALLRKEGS